MKRTALVVLILLLAACSRPARPAVGDPRDIVVFADLETWDLYGEALDTIFDRTVRIPREEKVFGVRREDLTSWDFFRNYKHIILCAALDDGTPAAEKMIELLTPEAYQRVLDREEGISIERPDLFRPNQLVTIITADTSEHLLEHLSTTSVSLYDAYDAHYDLHLLGLIYRERERHALEDSLYDQFEFLLRVPFDYRMDASLAEEGFLRLIKYTPQRFLFVRWLEEDALAENGLDWVHDLAVIGERIDAGGEPTDDEVTRLGVAAMDLRDDIARSYYARDQVNRSGTTATIEQIDGRWAVRLYGIWENRETIVGGPMAAYCFFDPATRRLWWLDGAVFAPELMRKEIYLRQVEVILNTFRTGTAAQRYLGTTAGGSRE